MMAWLIGWPSKSCSVWLEASGGGGSASFSTRTHVQENCPDLRNSKVVDLIQGLGVMAWMLRWSIPGWILRARVNAN